ncbi:major facilitator superfamily domain-containing protein [Pestalotiopsis sp. NC0098]|nr:major facilitator superfamily domain-containing protein [Pestalotiopsis sp. NC0098]
MSSSPTPDRQTNPATEAEISQSEKDTSTLDTTQEQKREYVSGIPLVLISMGLVLAVFCLGLDRSIITTAIPKITSEFNSLEDVAWYGSAYLLTTCCFQLMFGKLYVEFKVKWVFLIALGLFEIGSLVCGCAPNSVALIIGRAIQGIGCAGILTGALTIIAQSVPLHIRPMYTGVVGATSGIAQIIAPTLGGVLTDRATWRWCFWINLPLGAVTAFVVLFFVKLPSQDRNRSPGDILKKLDLEGTAILMPCIICLLLALEWGGLTYAWSNWRIILCLVLFGVLLLVWLYIQYAKGDRGTLPLRIVRQRSVAAGMIYMLGSSGALFIITYYVPIWFQSVKGVSAEKSGINFLAASAAMTVSAVLSGILTSAVGYYVPQMFGGSIIMSIAAGLIYRYELATTTVYWAGTLVMFGFGAGMGMQMPLTAVQTVLKGSDIAIGTSVVVLAQTLSGTVFLAVGQNLFQSQLVSAIVADAPGVNPAAVISNGVSNLSEFITKTYGSAAVAGVLEAYNSALRRCFIVCIALSAFMIVGAAGMEWKSVKKESAKENQQEVSLARVPSMV